MTHKPEIIEFDKIFKMFKSLDAMTQDIGYRRIGSLMQSRSKIWADTLICIIRFYREQKWWFDSRSMRERKEISQEFPNK